MRSELLFTGSAVLLLWHRDILSSGSVPCWPVLLKHSLILFYWCNVPLHQQLCCHWIFPCIKCEAKHGIILFLNYSADKNHGIIHCFLKQELKIQKLSLLHLLEWKLMTSEIMLCLSFVLFYFVLFYHKSQLAFSATQILVLFVLFCFYLIWSDLILMWLSIS